MPMIEVTAPAGAIPAESREGLLDELAGTLLRWEGAPDTEFFREITWVYFNELPSASPVIVKRITSFGRSGHSDDQTTSDGRSASTTEGCTYRES